MSELTNEQALAEIWELFRETAERSKETGAQINELREQSKETDAQINELREQSKKTDAKFQKTHELFIELREQYKETDARLDKRISETDARLEQLFAKTDAKIEKTTQDINRLEGLFSSQWGRLIEALVRPGVLKLFQERGHKVERLHQRSIGQRNGHHMEIDITLVNNTEVIPVEVKSTLRVEDVNDFLDDLSLFTQFFTEYRNYQVYGAVAGLDVPQDVGRYAYRKGLFVLSITGDNIVHILNSDEFRPKNFGKGI